jgi:hypothetical protein
MGAAAGVALAVALIAADAPVAALCLNSPDPLRTLAVLTGAVVAYCSVGATLSGYIFLMVEDSQADV